MAGRRYPVSVHAVALVQTEQLQTFAFSVRWSDNSDTFVRRNWNEFRQLQKILKETFPVEAGLLKKSDRVLPKFPDAPLLVRGGRTGRGLVRLRLLDTYVQTLLATSEHVLQSSALTDFFASKPLDLETMLPRGSLVILPTPEEPLSQPASSLAIHSLEAQSMRCLQPFHTQDTRDRPFHAQTQESLDVLLRHPSGWWLVENKDRQTAWFPAPYLEEVASDKELGQALKGSGMSQSPNSKSMTMDGPCDKVEDKTRREVIAGNSMWVVLTVRRKPKVSEQNRVPRGTQFCATQAYEGSRMDELSVPTGARVHVLETSDRGWWLCRYRGQEGLLPAVLLQPEGLGSLLSRPGILDSGGEDRAAKARTVPPVVPTRPHMSVIQSRCCTITRRAMRQDPGTYSSP